MNEGSVNKDDNALVDVMAAVAMVVIPVIAIIFWLSGQ
tara:strand:+ start:403 stop:516 length:114 start_codon:yes stop_codon:yes gene_type:complete